MCSPVLKLIGRSEHGRRLVQLPHVVEFALVTAVVVLAIALLPTYNHTYSADHSKFVLLMDELQYLLRIGTYSIFTRSRFRASIKLMVPRADLPYSISPAPLLSLKRREREKCS